MSNPRFSILIPIYNVEDYLEECLNSAINQTFSDFEIICVEDGSKDKSPEILEKFAKKDKRIKVIKHDGNKGLLAGRVTAVNAAKGDYFVFLDSDDSLKPEMLEVFDREISKNPVEVIMCSMDLCCTENVGTLERIAAENHFTTKNKLYLGKDILFKCFKKFKYAYNVIGKAVKSDLCRKVYNRVISDRIVMGEDLYGYFMIAYFAKSYRSIKDRLYKYNLGRGVTGGKKFSYGAYKQYCLMGLLFADLKKFLEEQKADKKYFQIIEKETKKYRDLLVYDYCFEVEEENKKEALELLSKTYGEGEIGENGVYKNIQKSIDDNIRWGKRPDNLWGKVKRKIKKDGFFYTMFWAFKVYILRKW